MRYGIANRTGQPSRAELERMLALAEARGVTALDTARAYGDSERIIGEVLAGPAAFRIVTKVAPDALERGGVGTARDRTRQSVERSLRLLRRERVDAVLLHRGEHFGGEGGAAWSALLELRAAGVVERIGVSAASVREALWLVEAPGIEVLQVPASLLDRRLSRAGFFARARERGIEVFVRSVFLQGAALLEPGALPRSLSALEGSLHRVRGVAERHRVPVAFVLLCYARRHLGSTVLLGCESAAQLQANLLAFEGAGVPGEEIDALAASLPELPEGVLDPALWAG